MDESVQQKRTQAEASQEPAGQKPAEQRPAGQRSAGKKGSPRAMLATFVVLVAVAFGAGLLLGLLLSRSARETLQKEKAGLRDSAATLSRDLEAARSRAFLWQLAEGITQIRMNLDEKNYGLARDAAAAARKVFDAASDLPPDTRSQVSTLGAMLDAIQSGADSLSPDATRKANDAADFVKRLLESSGAGSAPAAQASGSGTRSR